MKMPRSVSVIRPSQEAEDDALLCMGEFTGIGEDESVCFGDDITHCMYHMTFLLGFGPNK